MNGNTNADSARYKVVVNQEEQYSIWPAERENPVGWRDAGTIGSKTECLAYIREAWADMRPLSLRQTMDQQGDSKLQQQGDQNRSS